MHEMERHEIRRIAIFRALFLGDLLLSVPAFRAIRTRYPLAEISLISLPWARDFADHFRHYVDRFVPFPGYPGFLETNPRPEVAEAFVAQQRAYGYDLVIQMHGSGTVSTPFCLQLGGRMTAGYYVGERPSMLTHGLPYTDEGSEIWRNLELARLVGCAELDPELEFPVVAEDRTEARRLLGDFLVAGRPYICLHPGAKAPARRWPAERYAALGDRLAHQYDATIVITGALGEAETCWRMQETMKQPALNLAGETSLGGLAAILAQSLLVVSNDTGPAHLAEAVKTPVVTIHGPGDPERWQPLDRRRFPIVREPAECSPCRHEECPTDGRCLTRITPERVLSVADRLLAREAKRCAV